MTAADFLKQITDVKPDGTRTCTDTHNPEEQTLCVVLCEHVAVTLRQALKEPWAERQRRACLQLLMAVLADMPPELLGQQIKRLGTGRGVRWAGALRPLFAIQPLQSGVGQCADGLCRLEQFGYPCRADAYGGVLPE